MKCPVCGNRLVTAPNGEVYCPVCGYVLDDMITPYDVNMVPLHPKFNDEVTGAPLRRRPLNPRVIKYIVRALNLPKSVEKDAIHIYSNHLSPAMRSRSAQAACVLVAARRAGIPVKIRDVARLVGVNSSSVHRWFVRLGGKSVTPEQILLKISHATGVPYAQLLSSLHQLNVDGPRSPYTIAAVAAAAAGVRLVDIERAIGVAPSTVRKAMAQCCPR